MGMSFLTEHNCNCLKIVDVVLNSKGRGQVHRIVPLVELF
jgi:hypothetical protein